MRKIALQLPIGLAFLLMTVAAQPASAQQIRAIWRGEAIGQTAGQTFRQPVTVYLYDKVNQFDPNPVNVLVTVGNNTVSLGSALQVSATGGAYPVQFMQVKVEPNNIIRATLFNTNTGQAGAANVFYPQNVSAQAWAWHGAISALWEKVFQYSGGLEIFYFHRNSQVAFQLRGARAEQIVGEMYGYGGSATGTAPPVIYYARFQATRVF